MERITSLEQIKEFIERNQFLCPYCNTYGKNQHGIYGTFDGLVNHICKKHWDIRQLWREYRDSLRKTA